MKLQVTQENLAKALGSVSRVANTRSTLPILSNVLLKTVNTRLCLAATNLDIAITHFVGSKVSQQGAITVPARLMQDFISSLPPGVIDLDLEENKLRIKTNKYQSTINGVSPDEFPVMPAIDKGKTWVVPAKQLKKALHQVVVAASGDEARPVLTAVYFHTQDSQLLAAATDSYRLAEKQIMKTPEDISLLVPASAMQDLQRVLADYDGDVEVVYNEQQALFRAGDVELVARLVDGSYPDYYKLIPKTFATSATLNKTDFVNIAKVSSLFARESAGSVTIKAEQDNGLLSIRSVASQLGENVAEAEATVRGDGEITLNSRYLLDALNVIDDETVFFGFNGKLEPSVVKPAKGKDYTHVIMPLKS